MSQENENREKNRIIDDRLRSSGIVDSQLLASFDEAYNYEAASTINWLIAKLQILKDVLVHAGTLKIESFKQISDVEEFKAWLRERYPDIADKV
ncbi:MAG: hypothetical protein IPN19_01955 [Elusimicrobia bacterium]|nr:hypothetical protein [Elusimicrobiota bacterium]